MSSKKSNIQARINTKVGLLLLLFHFSLYLCIGQETIKPNILWICAEDIGPAFGCYGDQYASTPNIDKLAKESVIFTNAYATAPICSPARSALITGIYATSLGTQHLRSEINIPSYLKTLPEILRTNGYYCTNNSKTDYNFEASGRWDENGNEANWKKRPKGSPFFSVFNFGITHEGSANSNEDIYIKELTKRHDPMDAVLPPYFPKTDEFKRIWARYYDLISVFDKRVGDLISELKDSGDFENTIIFVFSDHGFGLPRYKRWLYKTGLHVPLVVYMPEKYKKLYGVKNGTNKRMLNFIDFAPTVLDFADIQKTQYMKGISIFSDKNRTDNLYGARSRADDIYDMSRSIMTERYMYIRNYMPHLPYIQSSLIFSSRKRSFAELTRLREMGKLNTEAEKFYEPKPTEELYDQYNDPFELNNLADSSQFTDILETMREKLKSKVLESRDIGFLNEAEYMIRSKETTPYDYANSEAYKFKEIFETAELVGRNDVTDDILISKAKDVDSGVRYWAIIALRQRLAHSNDRIKKILLNALKDESPPVALAASEALSNIGMETKGLPIIKHYLQDKRPTVVLQAAIAARLIGDKACPLVPVIELEFKKYSGNVWDRYKDWYYPMFIGLSFDKVLQTCKN